MTDTGKGAIVFDLDGTLIDSAPDLHAALNKALAEQQAAPVSLAETLGFIGHGIPSLVRSALAFREVDPARLEDMTGSMFRHYLAQPSALTRPYDGVTEMLVSLRNAGHPLGICTNKALAPTLQILEDLGLRSFFGCVIGGDTLDTRKPDPAPLTEAFARLGTPLWYVGDSEVDAQTAAAADVNFALFTKGYRKAPVADLYHTIAFDDFSGLPALMGLSI